MEESNHPDTNRRSLHFNQMDVRNRIADDDDDDDDDDVADNYVKEKEVVEEETDDHTNDQNQASTMIKMEANKNAEDEDENQMDGTVALKQVKLEETGPTGETAMDENTSSSIQENGIKNENPNSSSISRCRNRSDISSISPTDRPSRKRKSINNEVTSFENNSPRTKENSRKRSCTDGPQELFEARLMELKQFKDEKSHLRVPKKEDHKDLFNYFDFSKKLYKERMRGDIENKLKPKHIIQLAQIGYDFDPNCLLWNEKIEQIQAVLLQSKNDTSILRSYTCRNLNLWIQVQLAHYHVMKTDKCILFTERKIVMLKSFANEFGSLNQPQFQEYKDEWLVDNEDLKDKVDMNGKNDSSNSVKGNHSKKKSPNQSARRHDNNATIDNERNVKVTSVSNDTSWSMMFMQLSEFKTKHGHCLVPNYEDSNRALSEWANDQRKSCIKFSAGRKTTMTNNEYSKLFNLDPYITLSLQDAKWFQKYDDLKRFKEVHGHFKVKAETNKKLYHWLNNQRLDIRRHRAGERSAMTEVRWGALVGLEWHLDPVEPQLGSAIKKSSVENDKENPNSKGKSSAIVHETLIPLAPANDIVSLPKSQFCTWSFDSKTRVLLANFHAIDDTVTVSKKDEMFLLQMMERTDITVVTENLAYGLQKKMWDLCYIRNLIGEDIHHKVRRFDKNKGGVFQEIDGFLGMTVSDYISYLEATYESSLHGGESNFTVQPFDKNGEKKDKIKLDVRSTALYMLDLDMVKLLPRLHDNFMETFKITSVLPGGAHCMMNAVNSSGRPFMGPNFYISVPQAFTQFHQDGFGTVDSGHLCLSGYNEIVILDRIPEEHKRNALDIFQNPKKNKGSRRFDGMYGLPHCDGDKPEWPTNDMIEKCNLMNYNPSVFTLKPGQWVHINKGRMHAFRKLATSELPQSDCHHILRNQIIRDKELEGVDVCISIAWDWMYRGVTKNGINQELTCSLKCAELARLNGQQALAIPETATLKVAKSLLSECVADENYLPMASATKEIVSIPTPHSILEGILPCLTDLVNRHKREFNEIRAILGEDATTSTPNTRYNPETYSLDPYANCDFICKLCFKELSNLYMHCQGCENLLDKDFNICADCYLKEKYKVTYQMHPQKRKKHATLNHTGVMLFDRKSRCPCKNGPQCLDCKYCLGCSCTCHNNFKLHYRFMTLDDEEKLLQDVNSEFPLALRLKNDEVESKNQCDNVAANDISAIGHCRSNNDGVYTSSVDTANDSNK